MYRQTGQRRHRGTNVAENRGERGTGMATGVRRVTIGRLLAGNREFRALAISNTLSMAGDDLARVALAIVFYQQTRSAFIAAFSFGLSFIPTVVAGPLLATLGDRFPRRDVMVVCDVGRTALVALGALSLSQGWSVAVTLSLLLLAAFFSPPFEASRSALVPQIVAEEEYVAASVATGIAAQVSQILTYVLGALAVAAIGGDGVLLIDAATFGTSALVLVAYVRRGDTVALNEGDLDTGVFRMMVRGARDVFSRPAARALLILTAVAVSAGAVPEALAVVFAAQRGITGTRQGLLIAAIPIGTAIGGLVLTRYVPTHRQLGLIRPLAIGTCLPLVMCGLPLAPMAVFGLWVLVGSLLSFQFLASAAFVLQIPDYLRSRAMGLAQSLLIFAQTAAMLIGGAIATNLNVRYVVAGAGGLALIAVVVVSARWPVELARPLDPEPVPSVVEGVFLSGGPT